MNVISLFAGCGGLDLGVERAGFNVIWANECDSSIFETYRRNHPNTVLNTTDVRLLKDQDIPSCDGVIGGPHVKHGVKVANNLDLKIREVCCF